MHRLAGRFFLSAMALVFSCVPLRAQEDDLQLTARIAGERYCTVSSDVDALQITLRLRYTNTGNRKLILYKGNKLFYQIFVSRNLQDAAARRYETRTTHSRYYDQQPEKIDDAHPGNVFTVLSPGASYEAEQVITLPVARDEGKARRDVLTTGDHVLQVIVSTWYESKKLAEALRERWQRRGFLWTDMLDTQALSFNIGKNRSAVVCQ
ncbi:MAG TPA: hypothetical protein VF779_09435 [Pyrinomonadaceae bacterium]